MMCVGPAVYALYKDRPDGDFHWSCQAPPAANELDFEFFDAFAGRSVLIARAPAGTQTFDTVSSWTWNFETTPVDADTSSVTFPVPNDHDISRFGDIVPEPANPYRATTLTANLTIGSAITAYTCTYVIGRLMP
jgi:hypothetical protein